MDHFSRRELNSQSFHRGVPASGPVRVPCVPCSLQTLLMKSRTMESNSKQNSAKQTTPNQYIKSMSQRRIYFSNTPLTSLSSARWSYRNIELIPGALPPARPTEIGDPGGLPLWGAAVPQDHLFRGVRGTGASQGENKNKNCRLFVSVVGSEIDPGAMPICRVLPCRRNCRPLGLGLAVGVA